MKKLRFAALALVAMSIFSSCEKEKEVIKEVYVDLDGTAASEGLLGNPKDVTSLRYASATYNVDGTVKDKGKVSQQYFEKYNSAGYLMGYGTSYPNTSGTLIMNWKYVYERDSRNRITKDEYYSYKYGTGEFDSYEKELITFDDNADKVTILTYKTDKESEINNPPLVSKEIEGINTYIEDRYIPKPKATEADVILSSRSEFIAVEKDAKGNWTKSYTKVTSYKADGTTVDSTVGYGYVERTITYW